MATNDELYEVNDVLTQLATRFNLRASVATDDEYDMILNELTHEVAQVLVDREAP